MRPVLSAIQIGSGNQIASVRESRLWVVMGGDVGSYSGVDSAIARDRVSFLHAVRDWRIARG